VNFRNGFYAGLIVAAILGIYLARLWQPQRQIELHSAHLLTQIEKHNWKAVGEFVGSDYRDQWGNDRTLLLERLRDVFRFLPNARIESKLVSVQTRNGRGSWTVKITLKSSGEFADSIQNRVNSLESPFEFEWKHGATWPWDWKLVAVRNPGLEIPEYAGDR
jgi:hypothetical protein